MKKTTTNQKLEIGPYKKDATKEEALFYIDDYDLCVAHPDGGGKGDAIGRTLRAWIAYQDNDLVQGVMNLWEYREWYGNKYMSGERHPEYEEPSDKGPFYLGSRMSRDHYIHTLTLLRLWERKNLYRLDKLKEIVEATPFKIRRMARWTLPLILWSKSLLGNTRAEWWWLALEITMVNLIYRPMHWLGYKIAGWKEEVDQEDWETEYVQNQPKINSVINKIVFPSFAIHFTCSQLMVSGNSFPKLKRFYQKSLLKMVGKTNYYQRMILGEKVSREKVENYKPMRGGRWSGYLHGRNDRMLWRIQRHDFNELDRDFIRAIYNNTQI